MVVAPGVTDCEPEVRPDVPKLMPLQEVAFVDDHESSEEAPCVTAEGVALRSADTLGDALVIVMVPQLGPQLLVSSDSVMVPTQLEVLSAQRTA